MIKGIVASFIGLATVFAIAVLMTGWHLSRPVQVSIGAPPSELNAESISFESAGQTTVHGWWCPNSPSRGTILLLPGIRANRLSMVDRARFLHDAGYSVLLIDLRATGETVGRHITFGWEERNDVLAAIDFVRRIRTQPPAKIGIVGSSLGGAAALFAAPPLRVDALVLESVYPAVDAATGNRMRKYLGPVGRWFTPLLLPQLKPRLGVNSAQLRPVDHIAAIGCPVLVIGGMVDPNTTVEDTRLLFQAAHDPKELWLIEDAAGHFDFHRFAAEKYEEKILDFFSRTLVE